MALLLMSGGRHGLGAQNLGGGLGALGQLPGMKAPELFAQGIARIGCHTARNLADRGLLAAAAVSDFLLRHACFKQVGNELFPVHAPIITDARYCDKRFLDTRFP